MGPLESPESRLRISHIRSHFCPISDRLKCSENEAFVSAIRAQKEVARIGVGLAAISPGSPVNRGPIVVH